MPGIKTGRAEGVAEVIVNKTLCKRCGTCVRVCMGGPLSLTKDGVQIDQTQIFGCLACGQCVCVCPERAISVNGRDLFSSDVKSLPSKTEAATYDQLLNLCVRRRSVRIFKKEDIDPNLIDKILAAAQTAPTGIPPSDVEVIVFSGHDRVQDLSRDLAQELKRYKWMFSKLGLTVMRSFIEKEMYDQCKTFLSPFAKIVAEGLKEGKDYVLYNAPLALYFHASRYADPADSIIAATYAMLAGEALGLGTCMIGCVAPFFERSKRLKKKYGIPVRNRQGIVVIFGHPTVSYAQAVTRRFASVKVWGGS